MGIIILVFTFLGLCPALSQASDLSGSLDDMARGMATYFPKGTGTIVGLGQETVDIEMQAGEGLAAGVFLSAYRQGEPFYHPVTGVLLGRFEEEVTLLEVVRWDGQRLVARPSDPAKTLFTGDSVRLTQARIPIGILPSNRKWGEGLTQEFIRALEETGRFSVLPRNLQEGTGPAPFYWVAFEGIGHSPEAAGSPTVHLRLQNAKTQAVLFDVNVQVMPATESDFILESFQQLQFEKYPGPEEGGERGETR